MSKGSIEMLGRAGETIIANYCTSAGQKVVMSVDQYDSNKDMTVDGLMIEVKTQVPFVYKNAFTFRKNQLRKCTNADLVLFISVPARDKPHHSYGKVYMIKSEKLQYSDYITKDGREMILIPINQKDMEEFFILTKEECDILQRYSTSAWN